MHDDSELKAFKRILYVGILFLISGYYSLSELRYGIWGKSLEAEIVRTFDPIDLRSKDKQSGIIGIEYTFVDETGTTHTGKDNVSRNLDISSGRVEIDYLPAVENSDRISANARIFPIILFMAGIAGMIFFVYQMHKELNEPFKVQRARR